jgi:hypothetical protein
MHRFPVVVDEILFMFALHLEAPPEIWFAYVTGDDETVDDYLQDLELL